MAGRNRTRNPVNESPGGSAGTTNKVMALALAVLLSFACSGPVIKKVERPRGIYHRVNKGETLWAISKAYRADLQEIAEVNNITNPAAITEDSVVFIPGADHVVEVPIHRDTKPSPEKEIKMTPVRKKSDKPPARAPEKMRPAEAVSPAVKAPGGTTPAETPPAKPEPGKIVIDRSRFIWPMKGTLAATFGIQPSGLKHNGIRIAAREGTPIVASAAGEVIHASPVKYYGETIIIKHDGHYSTVYTFLKNKKVRVGDRVKKGERIALLSRPENSNGRPYLNFEIRQNNKPRNPLFLLPER